MSHHEEEGARFGYDGEQLAEDIRKEFAREGRAGEVNELSERSRQIGKLAYWKAFEYAERPDNGVLEIADLIEQALLAERRLAMEEAARIIETSPVYCQSLAEALRAAAEKEVGTK